MDLDEMMNQFRLASREVFNHYFHIHDPWKDSDAAWEFESRFSAVEQVMFEKLVIDPASIPLAKYKDVQSSIRVELARGDFAPIQLNREIKSGYWDYPIKEVTREAVLFFVQFFDWDLLSYRDNQYVLVQVESWPTHQDAVGKQALLEFQHVRFVNIVTANGTRP